jgi:hypothetical protein
LRAARKGGCLRGLPRRRETFERDDHTIAPITLHGKGRASGIELHEPAVHELSWRDGKLASLRYAERDEAGRAHD